MLQGTAGRALAASFGKAQLQRTAVPKAPPYPPKQAGPTIPHPWEEHFCDEFQIPFF